MPLRPLRVGLSILLPMVAAFLPSTASTASATPGARTAPAQRLATAPVIDGDLSGAEWASAATATDFTDEKTSLPVPDDTRFWLAYDDEAIYFAAYCYDADPSNVVMRETKRDGSVRADDHVAFDIDPFHTHKGGDYSSFMVNARGVQASRMGGGRSDKTEWKGDWSEAASIVEDGWTVEMAIPWAILTLPDADEPATIGFNVGRHHARDAYLSWYSNRGRPGNPEWAGNWTGVEIPASEFRRELLALSFLALGAAEDDAEDAWDGTARGGLDVRYRPSSQLTTLLTINPDFRNVQGAVEGIDFSRGERSVGETRPFFEEGRGMFRTFARMGQYFYTRRVRHVDFGGKVYGKLANRTDLGVLGTFDLGDDRSMQREDYVLSVNQGFTSNTSASVTAVHMDDRGEQNTVVGYNALAIPWNRLILIANYASSAWRGVEEEGDALMYRRGDLGYAQAELLTSFSYTALSAGFVSPDFRASNGFIEFPGRRVVSLEGGFRNEWREGPVKRFSVGFGGGYEERFDDGSGFEGFGGIAQRGVSDIAARDDLPAFFRDQVSVNARVTTRGDLTVWQGYQVGRFHETDSPTADRDWAYNSGASASSDDRTRSMKVSYSYGRADEATRHFVSGSGFLTRGAVAVGVFGSFLHHRDPRHQHILTVNYDFTPTIDVSGRVIFRRSDDESRWTPYVSLRRAGATGLETFLILGDPNADKLTPRVEGKLLLPL